MMRFLSLCLPIFLLYACATPQPQSTQERSPIRAPDNDWYRDAQADLQRTMARPQNKNPARNVILFIGDGMSLATVTAARIREGQLRGDSGEENALSFEGFPYTGLSKVYNTNAQVPDSAGTATALLSGVKTLMGVVGVDAGVHVGDCASMQGHAVPSLLEHAEAAGLATGIVSTARITHATPAAAYAHTPHRGWENDSAQGIAGCTDIARQLLDFDIGDGPEVVLGGGRSNFLPEDMNDPEYSDQQGSRKDGRDLTREWQSKNSNGTYVWNRQQFDAAPTTLQHKLLGLFEPSHMQYEADRDDTVAGEPSLEQMVAKALKILEQSDTGYFLLVEGGRIDHAHHESNAYRVLSDTIIFSNAVRTAVKMTRSDETLIVVTADHGHVMEIAGYPRRGNPILGKVKPAGSDTDDYELDASGLPYTTLVYANGPGYSGASDEQPEGPKHMPHAPSSFTGITQGRADLSDVDTEHRDYQQEAAVPRRYESHSGTDVPVYADGPGAWLVSGVHEQNYLFHVMAQALFGTWK